jgi:multicomponent Na+:H+ antiporter subunit G
MVDIISLLLIGAGLVFYFAGSLGLLRLPDLFSRLHALTKADNLGFGFLVAGLALQMNSFLDVVKLILIWMLVLAASATSAQLIAQWARYDKE